MSCFCVTERNIPGQARGQDFNFLKTPLKTFHKKTCRIIAIVRTVENRNVALNRMQSFVVLGFWNVFAVIHYATSVGTITDATITESHRNFNLFWQTSVSSESTCVLGVRAVKENVEIVYRIAQDVFVYQNYLQSGYGLFDNIWDMLYNQE